MFTQTSIATSRKVALTITLPTLDFGVLMQVIKESASTLLTDVYNPLSSRITTATSETSSRARRLKFPRMNRGGFKFNKNSLKILLPLVAGVIVIAAIVSIIRSLPDAQSRPVTVDTNKTISQNDLATVHLDRKFVFPLLDEKGKEVGNLDYVIQSAAIQKQIIVQGQRATAVSGRVFLILNLKITNNLKQTIQLNTRDYIRLITATNTKEQLAPDIHNDPVEVQAISTKYTRVGVAIDEVDAKKLVQLKIGEIDGDKQNIDLNFKY